MDLPKIDYTRKNVGKNIAELLDSVGDKGGEGMGSGIINPPESALEQTVPVLDYGSSYSGQKSRCGSSETVRPCISDLYCDCIDRACCCCCGVSEI